MSNNNDDNHDFSHGLYGHEAGAFADHFGISAKKPEQTQPAPAASTKEAPTTAVATPRTLG